MELIKIKSQDNVNKDYFNYYFNHKITKFIMI